MTNEKVKHIEDRPARGQTRAERPARTPINGIRDILAVKGIKPDMHPCWVNEGNVPRFLDAGYTFVDYDVSFGSYHVNQGNVFGARYARNMGQGVIGYLMEIPLELFNEQRAEEEKQLLNAELSMNHDARSSGLDHGAVHIGNRR